MKHLSKEEIQKLAERIKHAVTQPSVSFGKDGLSKLKVNLSPGIAPKFPTPGAAGIKGIDAAEKKPGVK